MKYNKGQETVIKNAVNCVKKGSRQVYQFSGPPGSGKTEVIKEIIRQLNIPLHRTACMAYTGQAASVMRTRSLSYAKTIHSTLYHLAEVEIKDEHGNPIIDTVFNKPIVKLRFVPKDLNDVDLMIIDEGSTVPSSMKYEIERRGIPIIVTGDINQLPPVKDTPAYLIDGEIDYLTEIMRQDENSAIVYFSQRLLKGLPISCGLYGNVLVIEEKDLTPDMIKRSNILLCGTNRTRDKYNKYIREDILGIDADLPVYGERVICRKNNWNLEIDGISLTNGLTGSVVKPATVEDYDGNRFFIDFKPDLVEYPFTYLGCDYKYFKADFENRQFLKSSPYSIGEKFELAYASTTHLSQGSQYPCGIYIQEYLNKDINNRLNYTAATRFVNFLIYVIPSKKYF